MRRHSLSPTAKLLQKAWSAFSFFVRERDGWRCITCGIQMEQGDPDMQAGHYIHKSECSFLYFDERNVNAQCRTCNYNGGRPKEYAEALVRKYGSGILSELEVIKREHPYSAILVDRKYLEFIEKKYT